MSEEHKNQNKPQRLTFTKDETTNKEIKRPNRNKDRFINEVNTEKKEGE